MSSPWPDRGEAILGTDFLGRPYTDPEKHYVARILRKYDYVNQRLVALRFAVQLSRTLDRGRDLMGRADLRLVRRGWDPAVVLLVRRLCRLVWSEWTNVLSESTTERGPEEVFLREQGVAGLDKVPSTEDRAVEIEAQLEARASATARIDELRAAFTQAGDTVNLLYLDFMAKGVTDMGEMARQSARQPSEFYDATKRRKRMIARVVAASRGVEPVEDAVMTTPAKPPTPLTPEELWQRLVDEAGEDEIERAASMSMADVERELREMGVDVEAERAAGEAFLASLDPTRAMQPVESLPAPVTAAPIRKRPRTAMVWLVAAAVTTAGGIAAYAALHHGEPAPPGPPTPRDTPSTPAPPVTPPPELVSAADLRAEAAAACKAGNGYDCMGLLNRAKQEDPAGDTAPEVKALREQAKKLISENKPPR